MGGVSLVFAELKESFTMDAAHPDHVTESFLALLEKDIVSGRQVSSLPLGLAEAMLSAVQQPADLGEDIAGDVAL